MSDDMSVSRSSTPPPAPSKANESAASERVGQDKASEAARSQAQQPRMDSSQVEATAATQARAGEQFKQFQGASPSSSRADPPMPGAPAAQDAGRVSEGTRAEQARRADPNFQANQSADNLAKDSPTAKAELDKFRAEGGRIVDGKDSGYFQDRKGNQPAEIGVRSQTPFGPSSETDRQRTVAHELGHYDYARNAKQPQTPPGGYNNGGKTDSQIEARRERDYVTKNTDRNLNDEAHATKVGERIRDEVKTKTGRDIGVSGADPSKPVPSQEQLREDYAKKQPSGTPPGTTYREYYSKPYREHYQKHYTPGGDYNL